MNYRKDIDGLRALAVLPVIFFHAGFSYFHGGFVGVDVFFVISGFLISSIILKEIEKNEFSIINFYERRFRRILPALFLVMITSIPLSWVILPPAEFLAFGQSLVAVSLFFSNFLFWFESGGYFDTQVELKPLLHTWSLAIEEQYYIVFPLLISFFWKYGIKTLITILLSIFVISFSFAEFYQFEDANTKFFLIHTRAWELLVGVFCTLILKYSKPNKYNAINQFCCFLGISLIFLSIFAFDESTPFPGKYALFPTLGTALLVIFCSKDTLVYKFLASKPLVSVGLISYSAYLWHQPILALARTRAQTDLSDSYTFILCCISIVVAYFSWKFIESPFRHKNITSRKFIFSFSFLGILFFSLIGFNIHLNEGYESRAQDGFKLSEVSKKNFNCNFNQFGENKYNISEVNDCLSRKNSILLIGDSHAQNLSFGLNKHLKENNFNLTTITQNGCLLVKNTGRSGLSYSNSCDKTIEYIYDLLLEKENITVIFSSRWRYHLSGKRYDNGEGGIEGGVEHKTESLNEFSIEHNIYESFSSISKKNNLIIINQIPEVGFNVLSKKFLFPKEKHTHSYKQFLHSNIQMNNILKNISGLNVFFPEEITCNKENMRCITELNGMSLYFDDDHPSDYYSSLISDKILNLIENKD